MKILYFFLAILISTTLAAQDPYSFSTVIDLETTPVISQGNTGTCWSFSSTSFLESEIIRLTGKQVDLSEMYTVRNTYPKKAENFVMRQGKAQFSEGGLAHDVMNSVRDYGLVPQSVYSGLFEGQASHNHAELAAILRSMVETYVDNPGRKLSKKWDDAIEAVLDVYMGENPSTFNYEGKQYTPMSFLEMTKIEPNDYVTITSFTHAPFYSEFILNIPDNWSYGRMYNVPLDEIIESIDNALQNGFTVELDCDVSERTFSSKDGVAIVPKDPENTLKALRHLYPEMNISQEYRQDEFENFTTTDDHLMHITGILRDQNGTKYYKVKNSWGTDERRNANGGYVYFSESYMRLKAISIMIHKDAVPRATAKKLNF
ncbi:aminopeptidase [Aureitalea sp. L0-47]|uniref:aminopeptidase C n=1 Tax=Aureitalea sp. L0-47 TaxID=2816962 RepID=UPI0022385FBC|nr:C1 family peptidase [Aureitalea sp. L0-47]MCW5520423.1 aminopeptidase [Aureitalea sp. L0-47]